MALFVPLETYSRVPSALKTCALGELPKGRSRWGRVEIVSTTLALATSITLTVSLLAFATVTYRPSGVAVMLEGCSPTRISPLTLPLSRSTIETVPSDAMFRLGSTFTGMPRPAGPVTSPLAGIRPPKLLT
jgi:hypothetical protein